MFTTFFGCYGSVDEMNRELVLSWMAVLVQVNSSIEKQFVSLVGHS